MTTVSSGADTRHKTTQTKLHSDTVTMKVYDGMDVVDRVMGVWSGVLKAGRPNDGR